MRDTERGERGEREEERGRYIDKEMGREIEM